MKRSKAFLVLMESLPFFFFPIVILLQIVFRSHFLQPFGFFVDGRVKPGHDGGGAV
jgi:hypothetical protein